MSKKRIALLINTMQGGGAERIVYYLLNHLGVDYQVHLLLFEDKIEYGLPKNQIVGFLNKSEHKNNNLTKILKIPIMSRKLVKYCRNNDICLVFSLLSRPNFVACFQKKSV